MFSKFAKWTSSVLGSSLAFLIACIVILVWGVTGPFFAYSNSWQLVINTSTTIVTFLMVFLIQNTQNRDTTALHLKLDELIRSRRGAHNELLKIEELSDEELAELHKRYEDLACRLKERIKKGACDTGTPEVKV